MATRIGLSSRRELHCCVGLVTDAASDAVLAFARDHGVAVWALGSNAVELRFHDPIDVMIGWAAMRAAWRVELMAVAASAVALELLVGDASSAWRSAVDELGGPPPDARGILAVRHWSDVRHWPIPNELSEQRLPHADDAIVVCTIGRDAPAIHLARHGVVVGRRPGPNTITILDAVISRRHIELARATDGVWTARDLGSSSGFYINGEQVTRERRDCVLVPGLAIQFGMPVALVVLTGSDRGAPTTP